MKPSWSQRDIRLLASLLATLAPDRLQAVMTELEPEIAQQLRTAVEDFTARFDATIARHALTRSRVRAFREESLSAEDRLSAAVERLSISVDSALRDAPLGPRAQRALREVLFERQQAAGALT
ncbi:MAG: hypothetical protein AAF004_08325 [Pseudomonadota bacterium]